jgi:hypothetical protein
MVTIHNSLTKAGLLALAFLLFATPTFARGFLPVLEGMPPVHARLVTANGEVFWGQLSGELQGLEGTYGLDLRDEDGTVHYFHANDVREIFLPLEGPMLGLVHAAMVIDGVSTIEKAIRTDYQAIQELDALNFDAVRWPGRRDAIILQRVNPGFDSAIRVYALRNAREWKFFFDDLPISGDEQKRFLAVKDGKTYSILKKSYRDEFPILFGDCDALLEQVPRRKRKFRRFADHVAAYEQLCGPGAEESFAVEESRSTE